MSSTIQIILVFFLVILLFYALYVSQNFKMEKFSQGAGPKVVLYYATWCGHCKEYKKSGTFESCFEAVKTDPVLKDKVVFIQLDYDENKDRANKHGINAFPSIIAINSNDEKIADFNGDIYSLSQLLEFSRKIIS